MSDGTNTAEKSTAPANTRPGQGKDSGVSKPPKLDFLFIAGILVGLAMTGFGFFLQQSSQSNSARLIMVCGLGVVLGAFGSTATIKYKAYVVGGAAAIALVLGYFLQHLDKNQIDKFVLVQIVGVPEGAKLEMFSARNFYGAELERSYEFLVLQRHLNSRHLGAVLTLPSEDAAEEGEILELNCIKKHEILPFAEKRETIFWSYDNDSQALFNDQGAKITKQGSCRSAHEEAAKDIEKETTVIGQLQQILTTGRAYAAGLGDIQRYTKQLSSRSSLKRRKARQELSTIGPQSVKPLLDIYIQARKSDRTRIGILAALGKLIRKNKAQRRKISDDILIHHRRLLLTDAIHKNRSLRNYSAGFLSYLGDSRMVNPALDLILSGQLNENDITSLLNVIKGSIQGIAPEGRKFVDDRLKTARATVGPKTQILIDQITFTTRSGIEKKYWVVVGAFKSRESAQRYANAVNNIDNNNKAFVGDPIPNVPFYRVLVGNYSPRPEAELLQNKISQNKRLRGAFLVDYPYQR